MQSITFRSLFLIAGIFSLVLLGGAYLLEYYFHLEPCPLCHLQRIVLWIIAVFFWLGILHHPQRTGRYFYSIMILFWCIVGLAIAGRHLWILHFPSAEMPSCTAGLEKMLATMPLSAVFKSVFAGSQSCMQNDFSILMLSLPMWAFLSFISIFVLVVIIMDLQLKRRI